MLEVEILALHYAVGAANDEIQHAVQYPEGQKRDDHEPECNPIDRNHEWRYVRIEFEDPFNNSGPAAYRDVALNQVTVVGFAFERAYGVAI